MRCMSGDDLNTHFWESMCTIAKLNLGLASLPVPGPLLQHAIQSLTAVLCTLKTFWLRKNSTYIQVVKPNPNF